MGTQPTIGPSRSRSTANLEAESARIEAILVARVSRTFRVRETAILAPGRATAREALARHVAMYLAHVLFGWTYAEIGGRFGRHRTCVNYACARGEDRRDEERFDARISRLERRILADAGEGA